MLEGLYLYQKLAFGRFLLKIHLPVSPGVAQTFHVIPFYPVEDLKCQKRKKEGFTIGNFTDGKRQA